MKAYKVLARPVLSYGCKAWTNRKQHKWCLTSAELKFLRKTAGYSLLGHKRNELKTRQNYNNTHTRIPTTIQKKLAAAYKSNAMFQTTKTNASLHPQRKIYKRETSKEMAGDRNRPLGILLERMMIMIYLYGHPSTPMSSERSFSVT